MATAEGGLVPSRVRYGEGCRLPSQLGGLEERRDLPSGIREPKTDFGVF